MNNENIFVVLGRLLHRIPEDSREVIAAKNHIPQNPVDLCPEFDIAKTRWDGSFRTPYNSQPSLMSSAQLQSACRDGNQYRF